MRGARSEPVSLDLSEIDRYAEVSSENPVLFERLLNDFKPFLKTQVSRSAGGWDARDFFDEMMNDASLAFYYKSLTQ